MRVVHIDAEAGLARVRVWRNAARRLVNEGCPPEQVDWQDTSQPPSLFSTDESGSTTSLTPLSFRLPRVIWCLLERVGCHRDPDRYADMYQAIWRITHGEAHLFELMHDPLVQRLHKRDAAVRREMHKTKAFVRFAPQAMDDGEPCYVAWFEPDHDALELVLPFFEGRFANMRWAILTPRMCFHWDGNKTQRSPGISMPTDTPDDPLAEAWNIYYRHVFNPARLRTRAMVKEMPVRYWKNLPEANSIPELVKTAQIRTARMLSDHAAKEPPIKVTPSEPPEDSSLLIPPERCTRCPHAVRATQAVTGVGPLDARIMIVGEQPGNEEDLQGRPFVGPAGQVLDRALQAAQLDREQVYLTNAVKHFKWELRGKRRLHKTPGQLEILNCRPYLFAELSQVQPAVVVTLGKTATSALLADTGLTSTLGEAVRMPSGLQVIPTYHPAYVLRRPEQEAEILSALVAHLRTAQRLAASHASAGNI